MEEISETDVGVEQGLGSLVLDTAEASPSACRMDAEHAVGEEKRKRKVAITLAYVGSAFKGARSATHAHTATNVDCCEQPT